MQEILRFVEVILICAVVLIAIFAILIVIIARMLPAIRRKQDSAGIQ